MTDCDPNIEECPVAEETEMMDMGEYVEDGYGQLSSSAYHLLAVSLYGLFGWIIVGGPIAILFLKPEWVLGVPSLDLASLTTVVMDKITDVVLGGSINTILSLGFQVLGWVFALV